MQMQSRILSLRERATWGGKSDLGGWKMKKEECRFQWKKVRRDVKGKRPPLQGLIMGPSPDSEGTVLLTEGGGKIRLKVLLETS